MTIALILVAYNEIDGVRHDIPLIDRNKFDQIFCIDGGSSDGTVEYLEESGISVIRQQRKGLNCACIEAVENCNCDAFVFFHPKGTVPVSDTYKFRQYFENGYELVIGSRMMLHSFNEEDLHLLKPRKWFVLGLSLLSAVLFRREGPIMWDSLHGFRGMTVDAWNRLQISDHNPTVDIEMVSRAYKWRLKRVEFATEEHSRLGGLTHFRAIPTGKKLLAYIWWEVWRK